MLLLVLLILPVTFKSPEIFAEPLTVKLLPVTLPAVLTLAPVTAPPALTAPPTKTLPPAMLPEALSVAAATAPAVLTFAPTTLPWVLNPESDVNGKLFDAIIIFHYVCANSVTPNV